MVSESGRIIFDEKVHRCFEKKMCKRKRCGAREENWHRGRTRQRCVMLLPEYGVSVIYSFPFVWKNVCQLSPYGTVLLQDFNYFDLWRRLLIGWGSFRSIADCGSVATLFLFVYFYIFLRLGLLALIQRHGEAWIRAWSVRLGMISWGTSVDRKETYHTSQPACESSSRPYF